MQYRQNIKNKDQISILGFGCMRFPKNKKEIEKQIIYAIEQGINFFDTAYTYGKSEEILGEILAKGYREKVKIGTKIPPFMIKKYQDFDKIFNEQLKKLQTDYIDYYFVHALTDLKIWERLVKIGILQWLEEKKQKGQIINFGFSYHGGKEEFKNIIDNYAWDFCMIQYNYLDENNQAGKSGLKYAYQKGIPVIVMEPLRGGTLVNKLPPKINKIMAQSDKKPVAWALHWLWDQPEIMSVLSGMNSIEMIEENIKIAKQSNIGQFTEKDEQFFAKIQKQFLEFNQIPCTSCNYCMPCPYNVDIPTCFTCYNNRAIEGKHRSLILYIMQTSLKKEATNASLCVQCGVCEPKCPQKIPIRKELKKVSHKMERFYYKPARFVIKKIQRF